MSEVKPFTTDELFDNLKALAKRFRKLNGKQTPAELYLVGGASIMLNYSFRDMTYDIDAIIRASSAMKDAIRDVSNEKNLPIDWLNTDFKNTESYSPNLIKYANYRCELSNVLRIYTISAEYLVAMKLMAGRSYKHDLSDVVGIVSEHNSVSENNKKQMLTLDTVKKAVIDLYRDWNKLPKQSRDFIEIVFQQTDLESFRKKQQEQEKKAFILLKEFEQQYPNRLKKSNVQSVIENLKKRSYNNQSVSDPYYIKVESMEQIEKLKQANITLESKETNDGRLIIRINKSDVDNVREILNKSKKNNRTI